MPDGHPEAYPPSQSGSSVLRRSAEEAPQPATLPKIVIVNNDVTTFFILLFYAVEVYKTTVEDYLSLIICEITKL